MNCMSSCYEALHKGEDANSTELKAKVLCRLCGKVAESVARVLADGPPWHKPSRHNVALKILFFELLREYGHGLIEKFSPWYTPVMPKPAYQNTTSEAFCDIST